jgi:threonine dehydratase
VFAALEASDAERGELLATLDAIGYRYWDETENPAYRLFIG